MDKVPSWSHYFMEIAKVVSIRSKDPNTKVGCIIVDENKHIIATGYNGFSSGMYETEEFWKSPAKYDYVCHAETNAIVNSVKSCRGTELFTTMYPCKDCAKLIANAGIKSVYYNNDKYKNEISETIFKAAKITVEQI